MLNYKATSQNGNIKIKTIITGCILYLITALLGTTIAAWLVSSQSIPESSVNVLGIIIQILSILVATAVAIPTEKKQRLITVLIIVTAAIVIQIIMGIMIGDGHFQKIGQGVAVTVLGAVPVILVPPTGFKKKTKYKFH